MWKKPKVTNPTIKEQANNTNPAKSKVLIKKRSKIPGVIITQYVEQLPEGKTTPDITRKPMATTVDEGKPAVLRAVVTGDPAPTVTWGRSKGELSDPEKYKCKYDEKKKEYILEIPNVSIEDADTYKFLAANEFGKAACTATLTVTEGYKKKKAETAPEMDFRKMLKKTAVSKKKATPKKEGEIDPKLLEILLHAEKKDYERICADFGITDFRFILKKLNQLKKEREQAQKKYVESIGNRKPFEFKRRRSAGFQFDMELKDPKSKIYLLKDGKKVDFGKNNEMKYNLTKRGSTYIFSVKDLKPEDAGMYQVNVEDTTVFSTELKIPSMEFLAKLQEVKVAEGEDAVFECVLSCPMASIIWTGNGTQLEPGAKHDIKVSEDGLIHRLIVKGCKLSDKGTYEAEAGIQSSSAALTVDANVSKSGKMTSKPSSTNRTAELEKIAREQLAKLQKEKEEMDALRRAQAQAETGGNDEDEAGGDSEAEEESGLGDEFESTWDDGSGDITGGTDNEGTSSEGKGDDVQGSGEDLLKRKGDEGIGVNAHCSGDHGGKLDKIITSSTESGGDGLVGDRSEEGGTEDKGKKGNKQDAALPQTAKESGIQFTSRLSDADVILGQPAELVCKLSKENCKGAWYKDGKKLASTKALDLIQDGPYHKLKIKVCRESDAGKYRFEADGRKTEATLNVLDPPRFDQDALGKFSEPLFVRAGENAIFKMPYVGHEPMKVQWYKDGEELSEDGKNKMEKGPTHSRLVLNKCQRKDSGDIKIRIKNEFGTIEATTKLTVLDKPTAPQPPVEIIESSAKCIEFKWRAPKDDGGANVTNYILERQQLGRNSWKKLGEISGDPLYRDTDVDPGRKYCYHIWAKNKEGVSDLMETEDITAGTKEFPKAPAAPKVLNAFKDCINLSWTPPSNTGGSSIVGYILEKRKKGSNLWSQVNPEDEPIQGKKFSVKEIVQGTEYEFRVIAINVSGPGEPSPPSESVMAMDPMVRPGKVTGLKVTESTYNNVSLNWNKPTVENGVSDEAKGYFVEIRPAESTDWVRCNTNPTSMTSYTVNGLKSMATYSVRVIAYNEGGEGEPQQMVNFIRAMPPPVRPKIKSTKLKNFMVVRAGNSVRANISFVASPWPEVIWLKDGVPVSKRATITNSEGTSQLLIPSSERSDTGIYTIIVKNMVGQETFNIEIRVTDDPRPPGPVELEQNIPGTVTVSWASSPDESQDDHLYYMVSKRDSVKRTWQTVGDRLFNNKFTIVNIIPGHEYRFRVYARNDMGISEPSQSTLWKTERKREKYILATPKSVARDFRSPPSFLVPLKTHVAPEGYDCYMNCAVRGDPKPRITWYRNNISINADSNYYITNTCGVCSMFIIRVGSNYTGEYKVVAENSLGRAECSTILSIRE